MNPNRFQPRELRRENMRWPNELAPVPRDQWPDMATSPFSTGSVPLTVWRSRKFVVVLWRELNGWERLSVMTTEWDERAKRFRDGVGWDDLQRLKAEAGLADRWAVELYPAEQETVNVASMRHIWLLPEAPPFAWIHERQERAA